MIPLEKLSEEQRAIVDASSARLCVTACAGSGKTSTAVHRLIRLSSTIPEPRGRIVLLSFSNVAVDTFREGYQKFRLTGDGVRSASLVEIETLDAFFSKNLLHPHAHRLMGASRPSFLVHGTERYLQGLTCGNGKFPVGVGRFKVKFAAGKIGFYTSNNGIESDLPAWAEDTVKKLGRIGGYTHELGRYWSYRLLAEEPVLLRAMARRYPHVIVDEAQDIGSVHRAILELLIEAGVNVSLIGDVNQSIYEFAGADGSFLRDHSARQGVEALSITRNRRSVPKIVAVASSLSGRTDMSEREAVRESHGTYFAAYGKGEEGKLIEAFKLAVAAEELDLSKSAVVCRAAPLAERLAGKKSDIGKGATARIILAALRRDRDGDYGGAFESMAGALVLLLDDPPQNLVAQLTDPSRVSLMAALRRLLWTFVRDAEDGLPLATFKGAPEWHPKLMVRLKVLLAVLEKEHGLMPTDKLGNNVTKAGLSEAPLLLPADLAKGAAADTAIRIDTVHKVKGETLDALLYIATNAHAEGLIAGTEKEIGRIGYVAATRARDLFWLGVPAQNLKELKPKLLAHGFQEAGKS